MEGLVDGKMRYAQGIKNKIKKAGRCHIIKKF